MYKNKRISICIICTMFSFSACGLDFSTLFPDTSGNNRGYTADEVQLLYSFAKLAAVDYINLNQEHLNSLHDKIQYSVLMKAIQYESKYNTEDIEASAVIMYPKGTTPSGGWPLLISIRHLLTEKAVAPSLVLENFKNFVLDADLDFDANFHPLVISAGMGFAIYSPDMLGFGTSSETIGTNSKPIEHPVTNSEMLVKDILLGLDNAVQELEAMGIAINKQKIFVSGFSQGAWLAAHLYRALDTNPEYSNKYDVAGGVCAGGTYDLQFFTTRLLQSDQFDYPLFYPYVLYGYKESNTVEIDYSRYFTSEFATEEFHNDLFGGTRNHKYIDHKLGSDIKKLYHPNFRRNHSIAPEYQDLWTQLELDSVRAWALSGNLYVIHHKEDKAAALDQAETFIKKMKEQNDDGKIETLIDIWGSPDSGEHESSAFVAYISGLYWLVNSL